MIRRALKILGSIRLTLALILSLSSIFLLGLWIPQKGLLKRELYMKWKASVPGVVSALEALGLTDIYVSPITLTLWTLFFLNLSLVMWQRASMIKEKIAIDENKPADPVTTPAYPHKASIALSSHQRPESASTALKKIGYQFFGRPERFYAVKNRFSPIATLLFHLSFFMILLGGVISVYTKFAGTIDLAEGEEFHGATALYNTTPRLPKIGTLPDAEFLVEKIQPEVTGGVPTGITATFMDPPGKRKIVEVNRPYRTNDTSFVIQDLGVAPLLILHDKNGRELDGAYVKLNVLRGKQDIFMMHGLEFTAEFFPDYYVLEGAEGTRSEDFRNPAFRLHIQQGKKFLARRTIRLGETVVFGNYRLHFAEMRYWVRFFVVKERGPGTVYAGFGIATIALVWRLLFYRREIVGSVEKKGDGWVLHLAGRAEFYKALFEDEFEKVKQWIAQRSDGK